MQKNVAGQKIGAQLISASDGSAFTGSVTVAVTIDAGTQAAGSVGSGACTHEGGGYHTYAPAQAETNGTLLAFTFSGTGAIPVTVQVFTTGWDKTAAQVPANVTQFGGSNGTFNSGRPEVNTTLIEGSDATNQIRDALVDDATRIDASALNTLSGHDPGETIMGATDLGTGSGLTALATASALSTVGGNVSAVKAKTDNLPSDPADESLIIAATDALVALIGTPAGASVSADVAAIKSDTGAIKAKTDNLPADPADESALEAAIAAIDTTIDVAAIRAVTDALPDAGALTSLASASALATADGKLDTLTTRLGAPADFGGGQSIAENLQDMVGSPTFDASTDSLEALRNRGDSAWTTADVSGLATSSALATVDSVVDAIKTTTDKLDDTLEDNSGTYRFTDDALAEAPTGGSAPTASQIADAVWNEDLSGHTTDGSAGDTLGSVATGTPPTAAAIADAVLDEALSGHTTAGTLGKAVADTLTDAAAILADTGTSGVVVAAGSKTGFALTSAYDAAKTAAQAGDEMDLVDAPNATAIAAIQDGLSTQASVDDLPTNAELATALAGADDAVLAAIAALHNLSASDVRTAIGLASANLDTQLSTIAGYLDTEIASIISTLSTIGTAVTAIKAKSDNLPSDPADQSAVEAAIASAQSTIAAAIDALNDLSAAAAAAGILDAADGIETGLTLRQAMRLVTAASAGKVSGADTSTVTIRNVGDTKDRITATVDESGNRTAVTTDVS